MYRNWFLTPSTTPTNPVFSPPSGSINTPGTSVGSHYQETFDTAPSQRSAPQRTLAPSPFPDCQSTSSYTQHDQTLAALTGEIPKPQTALDFAAQGFDAASFQSCSFSDRDSIIPGSLDPFQVQTPPPTRGPSAKRRSDWNQSSQSDTPSSMMHSFRASQPSSWQTNDLPASMSHPNLSFQMQGAVEQQRHDIGMSTDVAHMQPSQQPQQRRTNAHMQRHSLYARMPQQMYADSAGGHTASTHNTPAKNAMTSNLPAVQAMSASMHNMQAFAQYSNAFGVQNDMASFPDLQRGGPARASNPGVNPSLVYTSPGRFMSPTGSGGIQSSMLNTSWNNNVNAGTAPQSMSSAGQMQSDTLNIPIADPKTGKERSVRPGLQRSNTTGTSRTPSNYSSADSLRNVSSVAPPRRSSPLKSFVRSSLNSLSSISEAAKALPRSRTTVVLTIDSDGRARTETRSLTASPSKAMKTRYPTLWDGSDDDDDSDSGHSSRVPSRTDSISSSRPLSGLTRLPKLDTSIEDSQALRLPRSSSSASARQTPTKSSYATASHLRRQGSVKKPTHQTNRDKRSSMASLTGSFADLPLSFADERDRDATPSNAGAALRQAMEQRGAQQGSGELLSCPGGARLT